MIVIIMQNVDDNKPERVEYPEFYHFFLKDSWLMDFTDEGIFKNSEIYDLFIDFS